MQSFPPGSDVNYIVKTTTGDPAAPAGGEVAICANTADKTIKIYAGGAWRTLTLASVWS